ncbi:MAG TPA: hypothetical protein VE987_09680 [Polyangiaceae bacterium]|nr:hypothetical protein [Polyangiaceae bacterium]
MNTNACFGLFAASIAASALGLLAWGCNGGTNGFTSSNTPVLPCGDAGTCPNGLVCSPTLGCVQCVAASNCPTATPVCGAAGQCVQCASNTDCSGTTPACYPGTHTCRPACSADGGGGGVQCGAGLMCDTATGACVGCVTSASCPTSRAVCDSNTQTCVQCQFDADCSGSTPRCRNNACVQCASSADCSGATPVCGNNGACRAGCTSDAQCTTAAAPVCDTTTNQCVACLSNADCAGTTGGADGGVPTPYCASAGGGALGLANRCVECRPATADAGIQGCAAGQRCIAGACI